MSLDEGPHVAGGEGPLTGADLRTLVREVLRDILPQIAAGAGGPGLAVQRVSVRTDAELASLVSRVARECADPARRAELEADGGAFRLAHEAGTGTDAPDRGSPQTAAQRTVLRVERGAVTERHVRDAGGTGATIVAARGVVLTPLARDLARSTGVDIERER